MQFTSKLVATLYAMLVVRHKKITAFYPPTIQQVKRSNRTRVTQLRLFVSEHPKDRNKCVQPITHAYNTQGHKSTNTTSSSLVFSWHPPGPTIVSQPGSLATEGCVETDLRRLRLKCQQKIAVLQAKANSHMWGRGAQYEQHHDRTVHSKPKSVPLNWMFVNKLS